MKPTDLCVNPAASETILLDTLVIGYNELDDEASQNSKKFIPL